MLWLRLPVTSHSLRKPGFDPGALRMVFGFKWDEWMIRSVCVEVERIGECVILESHKLLLVVLNLRLWVFPSPSRGITLWSVSCFPSDFRLCFFLHHEMGTIVQSSSTLFSLPIWCYSLFPLKTFSSLCFVTLVFCLQILKCQFLEHLSRNFPYDVFTLVTDPLSLAFLASHLNQVWRHKSK